MFYVEPFFNLPAAQSHKLLLAQRRSFQKPAKIQILRGCDGLPDTIGQDGRKRQAMNMPLFGQQGGGGVLSSLFSMAGSRQGRARQNRVYQRNNVLEHFAEYHTYAQFECYFAV